MIIDTTEVQTINSFFTSESLKEVHGLIWTFVPILILILGITIGVLVIVWLEREISAALQQRIWEGGSLVDYTDDSLMIDASINIENVFQQLGASSGEASTPLN